MYASDEARDADIAELADARRPRVLRDRFLASTTVIGEWVEELADNLADHRRSSGRPGGRSFPAGEVGQMRMREVEIHHADLGLDYTAADWPPEFVAMLLDDPRPAAYDGPGVHRARHRPRPDAGRSAPAVPRCRAPGSALAWWVTGRGTGDGLTSDDGRVPRIGAVVSSTRARSRPAARRTSASSAR